MENQNVEEHGIEIWKDIEGYEYYQVSNFGRIKRLQRYCNYRDGKLKLLKDKIKLNYKMNSGYEYSLLIDPKSKKRNISIARLVAKAFVPNPENKPQVNHKNGIKTDNRAENIEWVTASENIIHSFRVLNKKPSKTALGKYGYESIRGKEVHQYSIDNIYINTFGSTAEAGRLTGIKTVRQCACGLHKTSGGYKWSYNKL
jgi:hypothetical protein